ncbi:type III polyketide synthase [Pseudalkalibacillus salsuginis]|uniref:type III polyketide synthase n=1 Tax=Pseudalkalibacillus salsuginis TaxID=2910972 RepID=UPI001F4889E1|nr:3-oxoacyl-[acyl-carrier-protein] synthase III C-terminal domain-containing protein [Pseudalkalibacillus salsuginis]MCF6408281.1 type III polyketide synthase [Pseudalkalibacillus salsuginis]
MPYILSVGTCDPEHTMDQEDTVEFARELFSDHFTHIDRLLRVFENGQIGTRNFVNDVQWYKATHSLQAKNDIYIEKSVEYSVKAIEDCLANREKQFPYNEIEAIFFVSTTGFSTPSIEARIMNELPFSPHTKRIPIWGLGCAGGASGLARAHDYCLAYPKAKVLLICAELCSLTFQKEDYSKSNLVGTSLFADGVAVVLMVGDEVKEKELSLENPLPRTLASQSTLMPDSEEVMGWDIKDEGLYVIFSKDIPHIVDSWFYPTIHQFLIDQNLELEDIKHIIAHPGGIKVLNAYMESLDLPPSMLQDSFEVLKHYGNMSSVTVLYVLNRFLKKKIPVGEKGLLIALGPGFSSEVVLVEWVK